MPSGDPTKVTLRRAVAYWLDNFIQSIVVAVVILVSGATLFTTQPTEPTAAAPGGGEEVQLGVGAVQLVGIYLLPLIYWFGVRVVVQGVTGWTPGKFLMGLRLTNIGGHPPGVLHSFFHNLLLEIMWVASAVGMVILVVGVGTDGSTATTMGFLLAMLPVFFWLCVIFSKRHQHPAAMLAGTYVVDSWAMGHALRVTRHGMRTGAKTVTRAELEQQAGPAAVQQQYGPRGKVKPNTPVFDKQLGTYVLWHSRRQQWMHLDQQSGTWQPLP